jgi:hypothetical protein
MPTSEEIRAAMEFEQVFGTGLPEHRVAPSTAHIRTLTACVWELYEALDAGYTATRAAYNIAPDFYSYEHTLVETVRDRYRAVLERGQTHE